MDTHDEDIDDGNDTEEMNVGSPTASQVVDYFADQQNDNWDDEVERLNYPGIATIFNTTNRTSTLLRSCAIQHAY